MKLYNINEYNVKEILKPNPADISYKNKDKDFSPYMKKKDSNKAGVDVKALKKTLDLPEEKKTETSKNDELMKESINNRVSARMDDSVTITNAKIRNAEISDIDKASVIMPDSYYDNRAWKIGGKAAEHKENNKSVFSFMKLMIMMGGIFLVISGLIYMPTGILWAVIGAFMIIYSISKK